MRLREQAAIRVRLGYRRLTVLLRREGWRVNPKRIYRMLYRGRSDGADQNPQQDRALRAGSDTQSNPT